jgi:hypothetical protein
MAYDQVAKLGPNVPPDVRNKLVQQILDEEDRLPPARGQPVDQRVIDATNRKAQAISETMGITLEKEDPESTSLILEGTPDEFLESYRKSVRQKALRLEGQTTQPSAQATAPPIVETPKPPGSPARIPVVGTGQALGNRSEEIARKLTELYRSPVKNTAEIQKLLKENEQYLPRR